MNNNLRLKIMEFKYRLATKKLKRYMNKQRRFIYRNIGKLDEDYVGYADGILTCDLRDGYGRCEYDMNNADHLDYLEWHLQLMLDNGR